MKLSNDGWIEIGNKPRIAVTIITKNNSKSFSAFDLVIFVIPFRVSLTSSFAFIARNQEVQVRRLVTVSSVVGTRHRLIE
jgi:hypothetical protein